MKIYTTTRWGVALDADGWDPVEGTRLVSIKDVREELLAFAASVGWRRDAVQSYLDDLFSEASVPVLTPAPPRS